MLAAGLAAAPLAPDRWAVAPDSPRSRRIRSHRSWRRHFPFANDLVWAGQVLAFREEKNLGLHSRRPENRISLLWRSEATILQE